MLIAPKQNVTFVKMTERDYTGIRQALLTPDGLEQKLYILGGRSIEGVVSAKVILPADADFAVRTGGFVRMEPQFVIRMLRSFQASDADVLIEWHSHPFTDRAEFSSIDDRWIGGLVVAAQRRKPGCLFVRGVMGRSEDGFSLEAWAGDDGWQCIDEIRVMTSRGTRRIRSWLAPDLATSRPPRESESLYARTAMVRTPEEQQRIGDAVVTLIGASGLGFPVAMQLGALGFRHIRLVDGDRIEPCNLNRLTAASLQDAKQGRLKVHWLADLLRAHDPSSDIVAIPHAFPHADALAAVATSDLVICAVDSDKSRDRVLRFAARHHVPVVDVAVSIYMEMEGTREHERDAHVWLYISGREVCFRQMGLQGQSLWDDTLIEAQRASGYVIGDPRESPGSVQTINTLAASLAVSVAEAFLMGRDVPHNMLVIRQTCAPLGVAIRQLSIAPAPTCLICGEDGVEGLGGNPFETQTTIDWALPLPECPAVLADKADTEPVDAAEALQTSGAPADSR